MNMERSGKVLFIGHSHVRRLGEYMARCGDKRVHPDFNVARAHISFCGVGGAKTLDLRDESNVFVDTVRQYNPQALVIMIGDNDKVHTCEAEELASLIVSVASYFHVSLQVPKIFVTQLLPRVTSNRKNELYDRKAFQVNAEMKKLIADTDLGYMHFVQFDFARFQVENPVKHRTMTKYLFDGVHLDNDGYYKMYRVLRGVVIRAVQ